VRETAPAPLSRQPLARRVTPLTRREWLGAKVAAGVVLSGPVAAIGALTVGLAVGHLPWHELISVLAASVAAVPGGMAISVYVGAQNPVFDAPDPRRRVTTPAGMSHFLLQALYLGATSLLLSLALAAARWGGRVGGPSRGARRSDRGRRCGELAGDPGMSVRRRGGYGSLGVDGERFVPPAISSTSLEPVGEELPTILRMIVEGK